MRVTRLWSYPVKSLGAVAMSESRYDASGLAGDRRWVLLDPAGNRVSARECPQLLGFSARAGASGLCLTDRSGGRLTVPEPGPEAPRIATRMSRISELTLADPAAGRWLSARIDREVRLAWQAPDQVREIGPAHGGQTGESMALADAGPILLITESSLGDLRQWVDDESPDWADPERSAQRFRPNVVIDGGAPYDEDGWARIRVGETVWRRGELCDRCALTLIDLTSLRTTKEPIRTLSRRRKWDGATWFGVRYIPELTAGDSRTIALGDAVVVLERA